MAAGSPAQILVLTLLAASTATLCAAARLRPGAWVGAAARLLAVLLVASEVGWWLYAVVHRLPLSVALPLHLCDIAPLVAAFALWTRRQRAAEIAYFWGLAGSTMALLTPDLVYTPGSFLFWQYVLEHGLTVMAALLLPVGLGLGPRRGALVRVALATLALAAVAGTADVLTGGNYMYLRHPPDSPTLLSVLGPWPWYIAGAAILALALIALLDLPFRLVASRHGNVEVSTARSS